LTVESSTQRKYAIKQSYFIEASPEQVFDALVNPELLVKWFLTKANFEPREGGNYFFEWMVGYSLAGTVKKFEKNKLVSYTFGSGGIGNASSVSFELFPKGIGTILRLHNDGVEDIKSLENFAGRWGYYLTNLKSVLKTGVDLRSEDEWKVDQE